MSNPADAVNEKHRQQVEEYIARDLKRLGGRRATAGDLKIGDRFTTPMRAEHEPEVIEALRIQDSRIGNPARDVVIFKTPRKAKSQWLERQQAVVIL